MQLPSLPVSWTLVHKLFLLAAIGGSLVILHRLAQTDSRWGDRLRSRWVLGVPWGSVLTILGVLSVYWFLQGGWEHPRTPMTIPYYSWSYFYPTGVVSSPFAHRSMSHLTGNLRSAALYAPLVEYVIGHYPRTRGTGSFTSVRTNPYARILIVPVASFGVGLLTGIFSLGPVIGFSGVVFAYAGFALVTRPLLGVAALVAGRVVDLLWTGFRSPIISRGTRPGFFSPPWADIAIQGHALGLLVGVALGILYMRHRDRSPDPMYLWFAALIFGIQQSLWAIYRPTSGDTYVLYRALGVGLIFAFAAAIATAVAGTSRSSTLRGVDLSRQNFAAALLIAVLCGVALAAVPFGFATVSGDLPEDAETVEVRDYTVTYVEGVPNQYVAVVDTPLTDEVTSIKSSGVVVFSEERHLWLEAVSKSSLAFQGWSVVRVGGPGWREAVYARREGWSLQGSGSAYRVTLRPEGEQRRLAYASDRATAEPTIAGRNVTIVPDDRGFDLLVSRANETLGRIDMMTQHSRVNLGGLTLNRTERNIYAIYNQTRVQVAQKSKPAARQGP